MSKQQLAQIGINLEGQSFESARWFEELITKRYKNNRPGLERPDWGGLECTVVDPVGNRITFAEADHD